MADATLAQPVVQHIDQHGQVVNGQIIGETETTEQESEEPVLDIQINNVVCSFSTRCHLNLKKLAMEGSNVEYHRQHGMLNMRIRRPFTTASVWSSGKITCTGATSEDFAKVAARKFARKIQKMGFRVRFSNFRVVNVLGTTSMPFSINIANFSRDRKEASYEPELHPGVTYKIKNPKATLKIFSTGSITVTAPCVANVQSAIEYIYPLVCNYKAGPRRITSAQLSKIAKQKRQLQQHNRNSFPNVQQYNFADEDEDFDSEYDSGEDDFESEESQD